MLTKQQIALIKRITKEIDKDFESLKTHLLQTYGDPNNDVGDAGDTLELFSNLIFGEHLQHCTSEILNFFYRSPNRQFTFGDYNKFVEYLTKATREEYNRLLTEIYLLEHLKPLTR